MTNEAYAAHKRLMQLAEARTQISILCNRIEELKTIATAAGTSGTGERVQTSAEPDRMDRTIIKLMEEENKLAERVCDWMQLNREILEELEKLEPTHRDVLVAYYIRRDRDDVTGDRLGYAKDYVRQIRRKALEEYAKRNNLTHHPTHGTVPVGFYLQKYFLKYRKKR